MYGKLFRPKIASDDDEDNDDNDKDNPSSSSSSDSRLNIQPRKIIIPDRSLRSGDAKKRLDPFLSSRSPEISSSSAQFEGVKKKKKPKTPKASGRLEGNSLIIDDIRDDYERLTPQEAISKHKPPQYPTPSEFEVAQALEWAKKRMETKRKVREDRIYQFLLKYAGFSFRNMTRVATSPAGIRGGAFGGGFGGGGLAPQVTAPPFTPPSQPQFFSAPGTPPTGSFPPMTPFNTIANAPVPSLPSFSLSPPLLPPGSFGPPPPVNPEIEHAQRAIQIAEWVQKPAVIGQWELSEDVFSHAELAFAMLQMRVPHFLEVTDMVSFMESKVNVVHTYFALMAVYVSDANAFYNPTRTPLDKNKKRLNRDIGFLVNALSKYKWDPFAKDFWLPGRGSMTSRTSTSSSGYPLPAYILRNPPPRY